MSLSLDGRCEWPATTMRKPPAAARRARRGRRSSATPTAPRRIDDVGHRERARPGALVVVPRTAVMGRWRRARPGSRSRRRAAWTIRSAPFSAATASGRSRPSRVRDGTPINDEPPDELNRILCRARARTLVPARPSDADPPAGPWPRRSRGRRPSRRRRRRSRCGPRPTSRAGEPGAKPWTGPLVPPFDALVVDFINAYQLGGEGVQWLVRRSTSSATRQQPDAGLREAGRRLSGARRPAPRPRLRRRRRRDRLGKGAVQAATPTDSLRRAGVPDLCGARARSLHARRSGSSSERARRPSRPNLELELLAHIRSSATERPIPDGAALFVSPTPRLDAAGVPRQRVGRRVRRERGKTLAWERPTRRRWDDALLHEIGRRRRAAGRRRPASSPISWPLRSWAAGLDARAELRRRGAGDWGGAALCSLRAGRVI